MPDKINPATLGRASTGQTFITEANHDYSRFGVGAEPRTLKFDVISSLIDVSSQA